MSRVNTYLNFQGTTEEAFAFYASIFSPGVEARIMRFGDMPAPEGAPSLSDEDKHKIMHAELDILGGHVLMATDMLASMGQTVRVGNNTTLSLELNTRDEAQRIYDALSAGGSESTGMNDMPWGAFWGVTLDKFSIRWMISTPAEQSSN